MATGIRATEADVRYDEVREEILDCKRREVCICGELEKGRG